MEESAETNPTGGYDNESFVDNNRTDHPLDSTIYVENMNTHVNNPPPFYTRPTLSHLNRLGDKREFGNFYDLVQERKERILAFLQKDTIQINNPDLRAFTSPAHAYENLLPYHLFSKGLFEDHVFLQTDFVPDLKDVYAECFNAFDTILDLCNKPHVKSHGLICELLLFHEQRYIKGRQEKTKAPPKRKALLNKRNTVIRLRVEDRGCENGVRIENYRFYFQIPKDLVG